MKIRQINADTGAEKKVIEVGIGKIIEKIIPAYKNFSMTPTDCRFLGEPILHPIDFVVFDGMNKEEMKNVVLLGKQTANPYLQDIQRKITSTVENKQYDWKVVRVATGGTIEIK